MSSTTVSVSATAGADIRGRWARLADRGESARTTVLVGSGRAFELARLLGTVAKPDGAASGHVLTAPNGRWEIRVVPDGSVELWSRDGGAVLRGQLAVPSVVAAMVTAGEVVEVDGNAEVVRSAAVEWRATAWFRPCAHCEIPTQCRNSSEEPAHEECEWDALRSERFLPGRCSR